MIWICSGSLHAETAVPVVDFLNSIGVCTHLDQGIDDPNKVATCLNYTGIRELRDDGSNNPARLQALIDIHHATGARVSLMPAGADIPASLAEYEKLAGAGALLAAEGPNEPNNGPVTYKGAKSSGHTALPTAEFQCDLYLAVKGDAKLAGIPVFASSEAGGSEPDNVGLQFLKIPANAGVTLMPVGTVYGDYANAHNYVCDHFSSVSADNTAWQAEDPTLRSYWDGLDSEYGHTWYSPGYDGYTKEQLEKLPRVTTETGWVTQQKDAISEDAQGKIFLDLYLDAFKRKWSYTFIYMLRDDPMQGYWGLVHTDYTPKLSATYLHNLTTILADRGASGAAVGAGSLGYSIANQPATVHDLLLRKSDGTLELAVWDERASGTDAVTVELGASFPTVKVYDPKVGPEALQSLKNVGSVPLTLSDHPVIIEIAAGS